jgi:hypothetical protein
VLALGSVAAVLGLTASQQALRWTTMTLNDMPAWVTFDASVRTMFFVVVVTVISAAVGGIVPALGATRGNAAPMLSAAGRSVSPGFAGSAPV